MATLKIGDKVCFTAQVLARNGHDKLTADVHGVIIEWLSSGKVARVDCGNTYISEDGRAVRCIPRTNLCKVRSIASFEPDYTDTAYEDSCQAACGL